VSAGRLRGLVFSTQAAFYACGSAGVCGTRAPAAEWYCPLWSTWRAFACWPGKGFWSMP